MALGVACAGAAVAEPPLLPGGAFELPRACAVDPFADPSIDQREQSLERGCGYDRLNFRVATPRLRPIDTGPGRLVVEVDQVMTRQIDALTASARVGWSGATQDGFSRLQTGRALLAAGGRLRVDKDWVLDMKVGRDVGPGMRTRATMAGLWRPADDHVLFAELAAEDDGVANIVGYRWWLVPRRAVIDVMARRSADGQTVEPRLGFQVFGFAR